MSPIAPLFESAGGHNLDSGDYWGRSFGLFLQRLAWERWATRIWATFHLLLAAFRQKTGNPAPGGETLIKHRTGLSVHNYGSLI